MKFVLKLVVIVALALYVMGRLNAFEYNNEVITWAEYEALCDRQGVEASYEQYEQVAATAQCLVDSEEEVAKLFNNQQ